MCVSRRLLSADAYHSLALARQAGDHVEAGLTFVAEDDDDEEEEESKVASRNAAEEGIHGAAGAASQVAGGQGTASAGADVGNGDGNDNDGAPQGETNADGGGSGAKGSPDGAEEEDDLYGDLYGGLDDNDGGVDMDVVPKASAVGGGDTGDGVKGVGVGLDGGSVAEAGAGGGGDGMVEDVSTRAVMNALKVREDLPTFCWYS